MRLRLGLMRRCIALALPCWMVAAPVASFAQNAAACRHHMMHHGMRHGGPLQTPCWCGEMSGNTAAAPLESPALIPHLFLEAFAPHIESAALGSPLVRPNSPVSPPTPPPPIKLLSE
jgi:hypothetical protein